MASKSKTKGKTFEREIANFLSDLYDESFTRVPYSGAFIGGKNMFRKEKLDEAQIRGFKGDIIPPDTWSKLNIECKNYADFTFHALFQQKSIPLLNDWIDQTYDAADEGDFNLIIKNKEDNLCGIIKHRESQMNILNVQKKFQLLKKKYEQYNLVKQD